MIFPTAPSTLLRHSTEPSAIVSRSEDSLSKESEAHDIPLTDEPQSIQSSRPFNVVLFGEVGAGKSSLVNLIFDASVARVSSDASSCTLDARPYNITIQGRDFCIFDTVGLNEPQSLRDPDCLIGAINKAYRLVKVLSDTGGIHLLVFCIQRGRITASMQHNYMLFHDFLCHKKVPIALVITHLENEEDMENWWLYNHDHFAEYGIHSVGHACVTARREFGDRYYASRQTVHNLLIAHGCGAGFTQEKVSWVTELFQMLFEWLGIHPRLDSFKIRTQKLREYGLREEEITALLVKIGAVDDDYRLAMPTKQPFRRWSGRRRTDHI